SDDPAAAPLKVASGFVDEFVALLETRGGITPPVRYGKTFTRVHDPLVWREAADFLLEEAGVRLLFHSMAIDALAEDGEHIGGVVAWTKEGRIELGAKVTIDASGDADVAALAGLATFMGQDGQVQNPTMIFRLMGVDVERFRATFGEDSILGETVSQMIRNLHNAGDYALPRAKIFLFPTPRPGELLCNATRVLGRDGRELNPLRVADLTEAEIEGRRQVREYARFFRDRLPGCESSFVNDTGVQVGVRQTRQVRGQALLRNEDITAARKWPSAVARSAWPIELHSGEKPRLVWLVDDTYEIPYECFVPERGEGLLVAGRCLSAEHEAMASARVTAQCFGYGQAIGTAAAHAALDGIAPRAIDGRTLRAELQRDGVEI
ncbi:MAG: FAD-dependent oxidoreductase, partial [Alphaproteobacteria bacterium]